MNKKLDILSRLLKADQIIMEELVILLDKQVEYIPSIPQNPYPIAPWQSPWVGTPPSPYNGINNPWTTICLTDFPMSKTVTEYVASKKN